MAEENQEGVPDGGDEKTALNTTNEGDKEADGAVMDGGPDFDSSKVKFINGGADARVDIEGEKKGGESVGLTKEELMKFATDPYWVKLRWGLLIMFWIAWFAMLVAAIIIIILAPKCPHRPDLEWWQKSVIYQVYPRSFKDSNGDGVGDLTGVESELDYLRKDLNITAVWLSPIYKSPMADFGYDISDHKAIDPLFGSMHCFDSLRAAMHHRGMKIILDFVPNHTSRNHTWFQESRNNSNEDNEYRDYYVWHPGKENPRAPPNNWLSVFGGPAWTFDDQRGEWYLHQFLADQPDLNVRNPKVQGELTDILRFWMEKGVDGFRVDAAAHLFETPNITDDEPPSGRTGLPAGDYDTLDHIYTKFQPETYELITKWRSLLDEVGNETEAYRFMLVEVYGTPEEVMGYYSYEGKNGANMPSNMNLLNLKADCGGKCVFNLVDYWMSQMPNDKWANWVLGNHDNSRIATRLGESYVNAANMLGMLLPGTFTTYYGEEIGMVDGNITFEQTQDPFGKNKGPAMYAKYSRDPERTPMQWSGKVNAGFSSATQTWLPVNSDFRERNVKMQKAHGVGISQLETYAELTLLRQEPSFQWGAFHYALTNDSIFSFIREADGFPGYLVAINFGPHSSTVDFHAALPTKIPRKGTIVATTSNFDHVRGEDFKVGLTINLDNIYLRLAEGVVFSWKPGAVEDEE